MKRIILLVAMQLLVKCSHQLDSPPGGYDKTSDIIFILDSSGSVGQTDFTGVLSFVADYAEQMYMSGSDVRFGLIRFSTSAVKIFDLKSYSNLTDLKNAIMGIAYTGGNTATQKALQLILDRQMFSVANGGRVDAPDIIITLTDGASNIATETEAMANQVKASNVTMFAIGITSLVNATEIEVVLTSKKEYALLAKDFIALQTLLTPLLNITSKAIIELRENLTSATTVITETTTIPTTVITETKTAATTELMKTTTIPTTEMTETTTIPTTELLKTTTIPTTQLWVTTTSATTELMETTSTATTEMTETTTTDICHGIQYVRGVAHLPYPEDCTKVIQCYHNPLSNKTLAVIRRCPLGHFWNQQTLDCAPSWTVECPFDKCQNECEAHSPWDSSLVDDDGTVTYPMSGNRRGYYKCIDGKPHPRCCPKDSVYVPEIGCYLNRGLGEECGPEESCKEGITVCKKLPVWDNRKSYLENSVVLGHYPESCLYSDFNIVDCKCDGQTSSGDQNNATACAPLFQIQPAANCSEEVYDLPVVITSDLKIITLKFTLSLSSPHFQVVSFPQTNCQDCYSIKVWGDSDTVNFAIANKRDGVESQATLLWKDATGDLDIVAMLHGERLTFGVAQGGTEMVTSVDAVWTSKSFGCTHHIKTQSEFKNKCILNKLEVFDCPHRFNNIYGSN